MANHFNSCNRIVWRGGVVVSASGCCGRYISITYLHNALSVARPQRTIRKVISEFTVFELVWIILFCHGIHIQYIYIYSYTVLSVFINSLNVSANSLVNLNCELDYG